MSGQPLPGMEPIEEEMTEKGKQGTDEKHEIHVPPITIIVESEEVAEKPADSSEPESPEESVENAEKIAEEPKSHDQSPEPEKPKLRPAHESFMEAIRAVNDFNGSIGGLQDRYNKGEVSDEEIGRFIADGKRVISNLADNVKVRKNDIIPEENLEEVIRGLLEALHGGHCEEFPRAAMEFFEAHGVSPEAIDNFLAAQKDAADWKVFLDCEDCGQPHVVNTRVKEERQLMELSTVRDILSAFINSLSGSKGSEDSHEPETDSEVTPESVAEESPIEPKGQESTGETPSEESEEKPINGGGNPDDVPVIC